MEKKFIFSHSDINIGAQHIYGIIRLRKNIFKWTVIPVMPNRRFSSCLKNDKINEYYRRISMTERPILNNHLSSVTFQEFYYLKDELVTFCKAEGLSTRGNKIELTDRISNYLDTGEIKPVKQQMTKKRIDIECITKDSTIEADFVCTEKHRAFFIETIGSSFSFLVPFQKWLKLNSGKTYD